MEIKNHLKSYGYNYEFSLNDDLCSKELMKYLGRKKFNEFWSYVDNMSKMFGTDKTESIIRNYIGDDETFLKILISGQIIISVSILEEIIKSFKKDLIDTNKKYDVLELGGYDGWSSDYLDLSIDKSLSIDVVDKVIVEKGFNPNLRLIQSDYDKYSSNKKYDVIFSILGVQFENIDTLINCICRNIKKNGVVYLGLRIQPEDYEKINKKFYQLGFKEIRKELKTIKVKKDTGVEFFPFFQFKTTQ